MLLCVVQASWAIDAGQILLDGQPVPSLAAALKAARIGSLIELGAGVYRDGGVLTTDLVTIEGYGKAAIAEHTSQGKAALVIAADSTRVHGLECYGIAVSDRNGACIRLQGRNLELDSVYFHDSQQGLLSGSHPGLVTIRNSRFERLGHGGRAHAIYVGGGELIIDQSLILAAKDEGHEVKSRAWRTQISNSVIASLDSRDSRLVDIPDGGELIIEDSLLQQGQRSANYDLIGYGLEGMKYDHNRIRLYRNRIVIDSSEVRLIGLLEPVPTEISLNTLVGKAFGADQGDNLVLSNRADAGLPPYPELPDYFHCDASSAPPVCALAGGGGHD